MCLIGQQEQIQNICNTTCFKTFQLASQLCSEWTISQNSSVVTWGKGDWRGQKRAQISAPIKKKKKFYINEHKTHPNSEIYTKQKAQDNGYLKVTCSPMTSSSSNCMLMTSSRSKSDFWSWTLSKVWLIDTRWWHQPLQLILRVNDLRDTLTYKRPLGLV